MAVEGIGIGSSENCDVFHSRGDEHIGEHIGKHSVLRTAADSRWRGRLLLLLPVD